MADGNRTGPLAGLTVLEMAGLGPAPFAALMLAEMGARIVRIERADKPPLLPLPPQFDLDRHGREILTIDLKQAGGAALVLRLAERADVLVEGFRPDVMERLGLGPAQALAANPRLVYARMTGFGQEGPLAGTSGHDLTYLAWTGVLHAIGERSRRPVPPLNLVADYGGGAMFLIAGVLAALFERQRSGKGQVVDAAMVDGASMLSAPTYAFMAAGLWQDRRGDNLFDGGAPFYDAYETADGGHVAVACLEPQFFTEFARLLPLDASLAGSQYDRGSWDEMRGAIAARFSQLSRDEWTKIFAGSDACVAPVLSFAEAAAHPDNRARHVHLDAGGFERPGPAPRFSRSASQIARQPQGDALDAVAILGRFGIGADETQRLAAAGAIKR